MKEGRAFDIAMASKKSKNSPKKLPKNDSPSMTSRNSPKKAAESKKLTGKGTVQETVIVVGTGMGEKRVEEPTSSSRTSTSGKKRKITPCSKKEQLEKKCATRLRFYEGIRKANGISLTMPLGGKTIKNILQLNGCPRVDTGCRNFYHYFSSDGAEKKGLRPPTEVYYLAMRKALGPQGTLETTKHRVGSVEASAEKDKRNEAVAAAKKLLEEVQKKQDRGAPGGGKRVSGPLDSMIKKGGPLPPKRGYSHALKSHFLARFEPEIASYGSTEEEDTRLLVSVEEEFFRLVYDDSYEAARSAMSITVDQWDGDALLEACQLFRSSILKQRM